MIDFLVEPPPVAISPLSGGSQSTVAGSSFAQTLQAKVTSADAMPVQAVAVQFAAPTAPPTASFGGLSTASAITDANGIATSPVLTSSRSVGTYQVTASVAGVSTAGTFALTNTALPGSPLLTASITSKAGPLNARVWTVNVANAQSGATGVTISSITFAQVAGAACTSAVNAALPIALGQIANGASASDPVTIDFSLCASIARFTVQVTVQANGGAYQKTTTIGNQFP